VENPTTLEVLAGDHCIREHTRVRSCCLVGRKDRLALSSISKAASHALLLQSVLLEDGPLIRKVRFITLEGSLS